MKLVFVTQELDPQHPALAQTIDLVEALAARVDELAVVTRRVRGDLPANAPVRTFDAGSRLGRTVAFERTVAASLGGAHGVLVHMVPQFALLAAPLARMRRVPLLLWYTHWHASRALRLATRVVDIAVSVDPASYPVPTSKLHATGHAIDVRMFNGEPPEPHEGPLRLLAVGRTARWKGLATLLEALARVQSDVSLEIRGPSLTEDEVTHRAELEGLARELGVPAQVLDPVARSEMPALLRAADVVVSPNEPRAGSTFDKAVFEAAACARPVLSTNADFGPLLGGLEIPLLAPPRDPQRLAAAIDEIAVATPEVRARVGSALRERVVNGHSLDHWADEIVSLVRRRR